MPGTTVTAASIGEKIFSDRSLSASGQMACATCHDPATGHASPFSTPVAFGGPNLDQAGTRSPPSLRYLRFNTPFFLASDGTPTGGFDWDGRAATLADQARRPFLSANEMANADVATVVAKVAAAAYAADFKALFGANIFADPDTAFDRVVFSLERYQRESDEFAPFTSKFDYFTAGKAAFNDQESRGLALFNRPDKGNCAACHASIKPSNAPGALFTDFTFDSLGLPRNMAIPANADPAYFDMGLCGPARTDLANRTDLCGAFKVPSLRNVALRHHFFHNGQFDSLEQVVRFYVRRDTNPEEWFPVDPGTGQPDAYNDLPPERRGNVNVTEVPYNKKAGEQPYLDESEIQDLVAFLKTLTDGYAP
ncbi:cytochrome-c peroxidase [Variovorax sp. YR216]|uniref:cytochrome-c peroxidase n=1 Tax=Variovorax sp. YR216 TaxID=1882828 RepID=UPI00210E0D82|nr:cytochrome c peroxidase [Variovorax sp. YR216]